jgi:hypothetical protein
MRGNNFPVFNIFELMFKDFRETDFDALALQPHNKQPLWGTMTLQHMVEHLADTMQASNGGLVLPLFTPADKVERVKNIILMGDREFQRNFKSPVIPGDPFPYRTSGTNDAVILLKTEIKKFNTHYTGRKDHRETHPVFGSLNYDEWVHYHNKHFTHHLKQFGLI